MDEEGSPESLYHNLRRFQHLRAEEVMIARAGICGIPLSATRSQVVDIMSRNPHSRYPVYRYDLDDMKGFVHVKDVFMATAKEGQEEVFALGELAREVMFVSPSVKVIDLLLEMRSSGDRMAIVVDEYGGVDGLLTVEDILEEIVGEMKDEYDKERGDMIFVGEDGMVDADARVEIVDLEDRFGRIVGESSRDEDFHTLGGLMFVLLGRVPVVSEVIRDSETGIAFHIVDSDGRSIRRVKFFPKGSEGHEGSDDEAGAGSE
jgi:CBS domain containing-hemolysin-like protein